MYGRSGVQIRSFRSPSWPQLEGCMGLEQVGRKCMGRKPRCMSISWGWSMGEGQVPGRGGPACLRPGQSGGPGAAAEPPGAGCPPAAAGPLRWPTVAGWPVHPAGWHQAAPHTCPHSMPAPCPASAPPHILLSCQRLLLPFTRKPLVPAHRRCLLPALPYICDLTNPSAATLSISVRQKTLSAGLHDKHAARSGSSKHRGMPQQHWNAAATL